MRRFLYIFICIAAIFVMTIYDLYAAFLMAVMLILAPLLSILPMYWIRKRLRLSIKVPARLLRGHLAEAQLTLEGPFLSLLSSPEALLGAETSDETVSFDGGIRFIFRRTASHCGRFDMGEAHIRWTDPFGFHTFTLNAGNVSIIVLPLKMGEYKATMKTLRLIAGSDEPERFGATLYKPGDNPHLINWKVTARTDDVYVRDMYPAEGTNLVLAADYARKPDERDLLCDALYSAGLALCASRMNFLFAWNAGTGSVITQMIRNQEDWSDAIASFLAGGRKDTLKAGGLSPYVPILYMTDNPAPSVSPSLHPVIWCTRDSREAQLSGKDAIMRAMGGGT